MIIPIRCFTCGKVLADKWGEYNRLKLKYSSTGEDTIISLKTVRKTPEGKALDELNISRMCCRRILLGQLDLIDII